MFNLTFINSFKNKSHKPIIFNINNVFLWKIYFQKPKNSEKDSIVFAFLQISLTSGLKRENLLNRRLSYLLLYSVCCDIMFWMKRMKKTRSHTDSY